jgi:hypothetical protein
MQITGITATLSADVAQTIYDKCKSVAQIMREAGLRVDTDLRDNYSPGWKFNHWELKVRN